MNEFCIVTGITYDFNHYLKWLHLYRLTDYCMFCEHSLRHPNDGCEYDRNMLVISNV